MRRVRSDYCVHMIIYPETRYEPAEYSCERGKDEDYSCDNCPYRYSKEDAEAEAADRAYDMYRDQLYFGI